jgi:drug/metabolite transporter (DMT)-like permease
MTAHPGRATLVRLVGLGILSSAFFSTTWVLNRVIGLSGGHWVWTSSIRFVDTLAILALWLLIRRGPGFFPIALDCFRRRLGFWLLVGTLGAGVFYGGVSFSSTFVPGWVVASTWQMTILATPPLLACFGLRVPMRGIAFAVLICVGIGLVNLHSFQSGIGGAAILLGALPVLVSAVAFPLANQFLNRAKSRALADPASPDNAIFGDAAASLFLLILGSMPFWAILVLATQPPPPDATQLANILIVAICAGVLGSTIFLYARQATSDAYTIAAVDASQATEVLFTLLAEIVLLGEPLPGPMGLLGVALVIFGLVGFTLKSNT